MPQTMPSWRVELGRFIVDGTDLLLLDVGSALERVIQFRQNQAGIVVGHSAHVIPDYAKGRVD